MKLMNRNNKINGFRKLWTLIILLTVANLSYSQDTSVVNKKLEYRITIGLGWGKGYPLQKENNGIGGTIEFAIKQKNSLYAIGARTVSAFNVTNSTNISNTISSYDFTAGKILTKGGLFTSVSTGLGLVRGLYPGEFISRTEEGFSSYFIYAKKTYTTIGIPVSLKGIWVPGRTCGLGFEAFANFNTKNIFYGVNFSLQFGRLNPDSPKWKHKKSK